MINDNTITIAVSSQSPFLEGVAGADLIPGLIVMRNPSGLWIPHTPSESVCAPIFVVVNIAVNDIGLDGEYKTGDRVYMRYGRGGDVFWAWLAAGQTVNINESLVSAGGGMLKKLPAVPTGGCVVATSLEKFTNVPEVTRIMIEVFR